MGLVLPFIFGGDGLLVIEPRPSGVLGKCSTSESPLLGFDWLPKAQVEIELPL
jgi:hypothetical protein